VAAVLDRFAQYENVTADTLYFGGGTPSLLGGNRLAALIDGARRQFGLPNAEITLEANPADGLYDTVAAFVAAGGNRVSMGVQAVGDRQLQQLGRRHTVAQVDTAVSDVHRAGVPNLSLDLMLGTPEQTETDVQHAVRRFADWGATHLSAYLLKLEPNTPFGRTPPVIPDEDESATLYLTLCEAAETVGYRQYEISNFAKTGYESRHNLKYWRGEPYLGFGPAAHSFFDGKRFYYPRSLTDFVNGCAPLAEENDTIESGTADEYAMLWLRLREGVTEQDFTARFGTSIPDEWRARAGALPPHLVTVDDEGIRFSREGFLLSDPLIARILWG
jgi:oxygen-independent coproporphyrinogen-3 oxidase